MHIRDEFARSLKSGCSAVLKYRDANFDLAREMVDRAEGALDSAEWFVFSDPISFEVIRRESESIRPAVASGLVGLPFPVTGFILRMAMEVPSGLKKIPDHISRECYEQWAGKKAEARVALLAEAVEAPYGPGLFRSGWRVDAFLGGKHIEFRPICRVFLAEHQGDMEFFPYIVSKDDPAVSFNGETITGAIFCGCLYTLLGMLLTPQVKRERLLYSRAQVSSRKAKRLPTVPVTYIQTKAWLEAAQETNRRDLGLNDRSSPRPHLRRGHVRTYASGHKVWINPMIIADIGESPVVRRDRYEVRSPVSVIKKESGSAVYYTPPTR